MRRKYPERWPKFANLPDRRIMLNPIDIIETLYYLQRIGPVCYLHPSFGYYFEFFQAKPHGMVYELKLNPTNSIAGPPLTAAEVKDQDAFWRSLKVTEIDPLIKKAEPFIKPKPGKYKPKPWTLDQYLAESYSRALNDFGVELQKAGDMPLAGEYFTWATQLNPANPSAWLNRNFNQRWRDGKHGAEKLNQEVLDRLFFFGDSWGAGLGVNGPPDEPIACYMLGKEFEQGGLFRQAGQFMERTTHFDPDNRPAQFDSVLLHLKAQLPEIALQRASALRARYGAGLTEDEEIFLVNAEAWALVVKNELSAAERLLADAQRKYPKSSAPWDTLADIYVQLGRVTNALETLDKQLRAQPDSQQALVKYGGNLLPLGRYSEALTYLDRAVKLNPNNLLAEAGVPLFSEEFHLGQFRHPVK
jgi:tetratricopeptide (TPR) repeat protein